MKIRTVSWEIIIAGLFLTGIAIYVTKSTHTNDTQSQVTHKFVTEEDSTHTIVIDLHNLNSLSQLDELDKLDKLHKGTDVKKIVLDLGFLKKTIEVPDSLRVENINTDSAIHAKLDSTLKNIPKDSLAQHADVIAKLSNHILTMTSSSFNAVPSSETLIESRNFSAKGLNKVTLSTVGGRIQAVGGDGKIVHIFITSKKGVSKNDFKKKFNVSMSATGGVLQINVDQHSSGWSLFSWLTGGNGKPGNIIVEMPRNLVLNAESKGGTVSCRDLKNGVDIKTLGGKLTLNDIQGNILAKTLGGDIEAHSLSGNADLKSMGGNIIVGNTSGSMDIKTAGGNISMDDMSGGSIDAETAGGNINARFTALTHNLTLKTAAGNINLDLPESTKAALDVEGMRVSVPSGWTVSGSFNSSHIKGSLNGGSNPTITAHTSAGSVSIK